MSGIGPGETNGLLDRSWYQVLQRMATPHDSLIPWYCAFWCTVRLGSAFIHLLMGTRGAENKQLAQDQAGNLPDQGLEPILKS